MSSIEIITDLKAVSAAEWDDLVSKDNPFFEYEFLSVMQESGCVGADTAWQPHYILWRKNDQLRGALPFYLRFDSFGEYIFDHAWAEAYHRGGLSYYPKVTVAVPFTPATGERILVHPDCSFDEVATALVEALKEFSREANASSVHFLFCSAEEQRFLVNSGGFHARLSTQYHWQNKNYKTFDGFLADLRSRKRKQIRRERKAVQELGLRIDLLQGDEIQPQHMDAMHEFYIDTGGRKWGRPYLNRRWFDLARKRLAHRMVLLLAHDGQRYVAGTLNFQKGARIFGRYWGTIGHYPHLHFELCYYRLIDFAIENGLEWLEAGAQGEHKFLRGFATRPCYSAHWFSHPEGQRAIGRFLEQESAHVEQAIDMMNASSPLKELRRQE